MIFTCGSTWSIRTKVPVITEGVPGSAHRAPVKVLVAILDRVPTEALVTAEWVNRSYNSTAAWLQAVLLLGDLMASDTWMANPSLLGSYLRKDGRHSDLPC